jgi:hypothetical protein
MKRVALNVLLIAITPVAFIFALILTLTSYHKTYLTKSLLLSRINSVAYAALPPTSQKTFYATIDEQEGRVEKVRQFLEKYDSPLEPYAQDIVDAADTYGLDYRLIPAIAMQESNLCHKIPIDSNNCWGFGIYGGQVHKFSDYKEGIYAVTKTLATKYKAKGLVTPDQIMTMWTPSSNGSWAFSVNHFMDKLK